MPKTITVSDETWDKIKVQVEEEGGKEIASLEELIGKTYLFQCARYIYHGKVKSITSAYIELEDAAVVFNTGDYDSKTPEDMQKTPHNIYVMRQAIESFYALRW